MCLLQEANRPKNSCPSCLGCRSKRRCNLHEIGPNERVQIPREANRIRCRIQGQIALPRTGLDEYSVHKLHWYLIEIIIKVSILNFYIKYIDFKIIFCVSIVRIITFPWSTAPKVLLVISSR